MKYLALLVVLCAASAFGQNAYGTDYLTFHCTAPDPSAPPNFGDLPKPGLVPSGAPSGNAIVYCDTIAAGLKISVNGGAYSTFGGGLPAGLTFVSPTFTISSATNGNGVLALAGNTSGTATWTAPAVAGTSTNAITSSNVLLVPVGTSTNPSYGFTGAASNGMFITGGNTVHIETSADIAMDVGTSRFLNITGSGSNLHFAGSAGQHINTFAATSDIAGVCSGTTTTCSVTFTTSYTATPSCVLTPTTAGVTSFIITTQANTGFTVTYAPSASTTFNYICIGNPN